MLALCLLSMTLAWRERFGWAGVAIGAAAAMKLFAWPVVVVLGGFRLAKDFLGTGYRYSGVGFVAEHHP